ncbi:hypothetical protein BDV96DRAFT_579471 [Lophiotrema nucula]|uniref:Mitochondrial outer membrane protein n=1 Tax=Lophiotrema nucula TaxID=690887 RepID=A0A6A5Z3S1_9PLEO|nr:hypothetical protein BDV96DRAFT_579471 [Lophiotrema nucula]
MRRTTTKRWTMSTAPASNDSNTQTNPNARPQPSRSVFSVPAPVRRLFDKFPLRSYPANELPLRAPRKRQENVLYVFATEEGVKNGVPSYNPHCLKWQTYLKFSDISFRIASANNHASPSGALPFLLPGSNEVAKPPQPIPSAKLQRWCREHAKERAIEEPDDMRYEAYLSLLDHRIRRAWLYTVYLSANSTTLAEPLYILRTSSNPLVRLAIAHELRRAASAELLKFSAVINEDQLYEDAEDAFVALEMLLGDKQWFFAADKPGLFDAAVFAYTHLLLDDGLGKGWIDVRLHDAVLQRQRLVEHRERILQAYF